MALEALSSACWDRGALKPKPMEALTGEVNGGTETGEPTERESIGGQVDMLIDPDEGLSAVRKPDWTEIEMKLKRDR